jgi:PAS domain S-box-containing protein
MTQFSDQDGFYDKLHQRWRMLNETHSMQAIAQLALDFAVEELGFQQAVLFIHDDETGLFKASFHRGYAQRSELQQLEIVRLLLSGEIIQTLRHSHEPILHTSQAPAPLVQSLLQCLGMDEALLAQFGGDVDIPHGIVVVGNRSGASQRPVVTVADPWVRVALQNLILHLSNAVNTARYYQAWAGEKKFLQHNIDVRTQEIREKQEQFEAIYQASKDGIAVLDVHTTAFLDANPAYLEMMGFTRAELQRTSCLALTLEKDLPASRQAVADVRSKGFVRDFVKTCLIKGGQQITVNMSLALMHGDQQILVTAKDMTSRYLLERALRAAKNKAEAAQAELAQKNRVLEELTANLESMVDTRTDELARALTQAQAAAKAKSQFLATVSHEIRTPINGVLGMTELLAATSLSQEQLQLLHMLQSSGNSLKGIINDILDFSSIDAGKLDLDNATFSLADLLDDLKQDFAVQAQEQDLQLSLQYSPNLPAWVMGDASRLRQVFSNLISNAIKFTPKGDVAISVLATETPDVYQATIRDTGIGMSPAVLSHLFNAFMQANASTTREYGGTGLGLVISASLVQRMHGRIWVESEVGQGSSFHFTFHAPRGRQAPAIKPVQPVTATDMSYLRVLLVEDHHVNRLLVMKFLQKLGVEPDVALDGQEALACLKSKAYDVILMDIQMPNMDGLTATRHIRANIHIHQPHIIALTANAFAEDRAVCHDVGMNDFVSKPVSMARLVDALSHVPVQH